MTLRPLGHEDVDAVAALEVDAYEPALHESTEAFHRLIDLFPDGAIAALDGAGLCGYAFGVPLAAGAMLDLRTPLAAIPRAADMFYVHDVAVAARCRGRGVGRALAEGLLAAGRRHGFRRFELVSVQGSAPFWERFGFVATRRFDYAPGAPSVQMVMTAQ